MKYRVLIIFLSTFPIFFYSQNLKIDYKIGGYGFGKIAEYERQEIVKIYPEKLNFRMDFIQLKKAWIYNDSTKQNNLSKTDTLEIISKKISKNDVQGLISELDKERNNFNYSFIIQNIKSSISEREIIRIAKKLDIFYLIGDEETNRMDEFDRDKIREIKNLRDFDKYIEYIKPKSDSIVQRIFIDAWNFLIIENGNKNYKFDFNDDLGQPINKSTKPYINLDINNKLKKILPKHSILRKEIEFESLFEDYVYWFLHR